MTIDPFFAIGLCAFVILFIVMVIRKFKSAVHFEGTATAPLETKRSGTVGTPPISEETEKRIALLFIPEDRQAVRTILRDECGNNLPFLHNPEHSDMDRIRFAVLKLSKGRLDKLEKAVELAKIDWRDALCAAGFGGKPGKHRMWLPRSRTEPTAWSRLMQRWADRR